MEELEEKDKDEDDEEEEEETVDEKIDRLGREVEDLKEQVGRMLESSPPASWPEWPPVPEPLLELRHAIEEKDTERELLLEEQRVSKVAEEYLEENPSILAKVAECPICLEHIFDVEGALLCQICGKSICRDCESPFRAASDDTCPLCRQKFPSDEKEHLHMVRTNAAEGRAWAQCSLAVAYGSGTLGLAVDKEEAGSLLRKAADQGYSSAQFRLGLFVHERNNASEACELFQAAASQGHMHALGALGKHYLRGESVEKDWSKTTRLYTVSAKLQKSDRSPHAMLGWFFAKGEGGLGRSMERSVYYFRLAFEENELPPNFMRVYAKALLSISDTYYPDDEIPPSGHSNLPTALFWYRLALAKSMDAEAAQFVESYESKIKERCACCCKPLSTDKPKCCVECKAACYCSRECQVEDWKAGHKEDCVKSLKQRLRETGKFDDL